MIFDHHENQNILVVDDEEQVRLVLQRYLENEGYTCKTATDGQAAIDLLGREQFAAMILDIMMPGMSGIEVLKRAREHDKDLAVIIASAIDDRQTAYKSFELGAFGYIIKPFEKNELLIAVRNALLRRRLTREIRSYRTGLENTIASRTGELMHSNILLQQRYSEKEALAGSLEDSLKESKELSDTISRQKEDLEKSLEEITNLIILAAEKKDFSVRFANPQLGECYRVQQCSKEDCPCYGKGASRCWQIAGTLCDGEVQGEFAQKYQSCKKCPFYQAVTADFSLKIGEEFNNMMHILEQKNNKLLKAYDSLQKTQQQVVRQEKMASIGQLSAGIAHEINNPVGYISSNLTTLGKYAERLTEFIHRLSDGTEEIGASESDIISELKRQLKIDRILDDLPDLIAESSEGCDRIKSIVMDLKSFARDEGDRSELGDINDIIDKSLNIAWNELKYKATVQKQFGDLPLTLCQPHRLGQVFINLLVNAAHAIEKQGTITIRTWLEDNMIYASVADNGGGIKPEQLEQIFSPFFTTKEIGKGTGLGLSIAKEIMERHQGGIKVESIFGQGSTFVIWLPVNEKC